MMKDVTDEEIERAIAEADAAAAAQRHLRLAAATGRPVELDCETAGLTPCPECWHGEPERCTRQTLPDEVHAACEAEAHRLAAERAGPCHDCAFRPGSHEAIAEDWATGRPVLDTVAKQAEPFRCHQAMPLDGRGRVPADGDFAPRRHTLYPICAGWARAQAARKDR